MKAGGSAAFVAAAVRTPIGRFLGGLAGVTAVELGAIAARAAVERAGVRSEDVDGLIFGNARQAGVGPNPARQIGVAAGLPIETPAYTINMACASGLKAIELCVQAIAAGELASIAEARAVIARSFPVTQYEPEGEWAEARARFADVVARRLPASTAP